VGKTTFDALYIMSCCLGSAFGVVGGDVRFMWLQS
jgi:hypothetical protein